MHCVYVLVHTIYYLHTFKHNPHHIQFQVLTFLKKIQDLDLFFAINWWWLKKSRKSFFWDSFRLYSLCD